MSRRLKAMVSAAAVGVAVLVVVAFQGDSVSAEVVALPRGPLRETVTAQGVTRLKERRVVMAPVSGSLALISSKAGDVVGAGQPLAQILPFQASLLDSRTRSTLAAQIAAARAAESTARAAVERSRLASQQADRELERTRILASSLSAPAAHLEEAETAARLRQTELAAAESALVSARANTASLRAAAARSSSPVADEVVTVTSPVAGRVLRVHAPDPGPVEAGARLLEVGDVRALEVVADLLTADARMVRPGMLVEVSDAGSAPLRGRVRLVEPSGFTKISSLGIEEQRANVVIDLADDPDRLSLGDAFRVMVKIVTWEAPEVTQVPNTALFRDGEALYAVAVDGGRAAMRQVRVGHRGEEYSEVLDGLAPGTTVVRYPDNRIAAGIHIKPQAAQ